MRRTNSPDTSRDWNWADGFLDHAKEIVGKHLLVAAPMEIDCKDATDIMLITDRGATAFRVRRPAHLQMYRYDITFRSGRVGFEKTELDKILDGKAQWMLYGFGSDDGRTISHWVLLDLAALRGAFLRGKLVRAAPILNRDGETSFEAYDTRRLKGLDRAIIFAASEDIPTDVTPMAPKRFISKREAFREALERSAEESKPRDV